MELKRKSNKNAFHPPPYGRGLLGAKVKSAPRKTASPALRAALLHNEDVLTIRACLRVLVAVYANFPECPQ